MAGTSVMELRSVPLLYRVIDHITIPPERLTIRFLCTIEVGNLFVNGDIANVISILLPW